MKHLKTLRTIALISSLGLATSVFASQADIDRIEQAAAVLDTSTLQSLSNEMTGYDQALANYRLAVSANVKKDSALALQASNSAIQQLKAITQEQPDHVEATALLAQLYGYKISLQPMKAMFLGPKSIKHLKAAETLAPNNPRVQLFKGIGKAHTPPMFGGSMEEALTAFSAAILSYQEDEYSGYHWGEAEAYTWRGLMYQSQGNLQQATRDWQQALVVDPGCGWAKSLLETTQL